MRQKTLNTLVACGATGLLGFIGFVAFYRKFPTRPSGAMDPADLQINKEGFSTAAGQPWIDAGVWLANKLNKNKVTPNSAEQQLFVSTFTELGVDETGIIRYSPSTAQVEKVQTDMAGAIASPEVRTIIADFVSATQTLPAKVLV